MKNFTLAIFLALFGVSFAHASATSPGDYYVTSNKLNVRLAPNKSGKNTNTLYKRQKVKVFEIKDDGLVKSLHPHNGLKTNGIQDESV